MTSDNYSHDLRNLWQSQESGSFSMSEEELRKAAVKFTRRIFRRNIREYMAAAIVVIGYGYYIYKFHSLLVRIGSVLIIAAAIWVSFHIHRKGSSRAMNAEMDAQSCLEFHRSELVRQRDLLLRIWTWYLLPFAIGLAVFLLGLMQMTLENPAARMHAGHIAAGFGAAFAVCAGAFVLLGKLNQWAAKKLQRKIDALDALRKPPG